MHGFFGKKQYAARAPSMLTMKLSNDLCLECSTWAIFFNQSSLTFQASCSKLHVSSLTLQASCSKSHVSSLTLQASRFKSLSCRISIEIFAPVWARNFFLVGAQIFVSQIDVAKVRQCHCGSRMFSQKIFLSCKFYSTRTRKTTFSVKVSTFLVNCQLIQEIDCQLHQEKSNKLSTKSGKDRIIQLLPGLRIKVPNKHSTNGRVKVKSIQLFLG